MLSTFFKNPMNKKALTNIDTQGVTSSNLVSPTKVVEVTLSEPINIELMPSRFFTKKKYSEGFWNLVDYVPIMCHFFLDMCHLCGTTGGVNSIGRVSARQAGSCGFESHTPHK